MENIKDAQNKGNLQKGFYLITVLVLNKFTVEKVISLFYCLRCLFLSLWYFLWLAHITVKIKF